MDEVLAATDRLLLTPYVYPASWADEGDLVRQSVSLMGIAIVGAYALYLGVAGASYVLFFDKRLEQHPKFLKNQIRLELQSACGALPFMALLNLPFFLAEVRGHTLMYDTLGERSAAYTLLSVLCFFAWNDCIIYWVHRLLHHKALYKHCHKEHHKWLVPTPFASHAFHPVDGFLQGVAYNLFTFVIPINKWVHLGAFVAVNFWTIGIHAGAHNFEKVVPRSLRWLINGDAHHVDHHLYFNYNHGQYTTIWDRIGGTYREPSAYQGKGPLDDLARKTL